MRRWLLFGSLTILMTAAGWAELPEAFEGSADHPAIGYSQPAHDPVAELNQRLQEGKVELRCLCAFDQDHWRLTPRYNVPKSK